MTAEADVVIVGGGPAGLAAAIELRRLGVACVVVLEREAEAGGVPRHTGHLGFGIRDLHRVLSGPRYAARYVRSARAAGVDVRTETSVTGWAGVRSVAVTAPTGRGEVRGRVVLLATGCRERPRAARLVPGARPLGVLTTGALQQLVYLEGQHRLGRRAVIVGAEHVSFSAVVTLAHGGVETVALVTEHPRHQSHPALVWATAGWRRVPVHANSVLTGIIGGRRVEAVEVSDLVTGAVRRIACDTVVFTGDWIPDHELARGGGLVIDATRGPRVDLALRTSAPGIFAAGNLVHAAEAADAAALSGRHAARAVFAHLGGVPWPLEPPLPLVCSPPLRWISPSAISAAGDDGDTIRTSAPRGRFVLRTAAFVDDATLEVRQGARVLRRERRGRLVPARSIRLDAAWVKDVDPQGAPIAIGVVSSQPRV